jgi:hypothetical protein
VKWSLITSFALVLIIGFFILWTLYPSKQPKVVSHSVLSTTSSPVLQNQQSAPVPPTSPTASPTSMWLQHISITKSPNLHGWTTLTDNSAHFSINYPSSVGFHFSIVSPYDDNYGAVTPILHNPIAEMIALSPTSEALSQTTVSEANIFIDVAAGPCDFDDLSNVATSTANGMTFYVTSLDNAAMGQSFWGEIYSTNTHGNCYSVGWYIDVTSLSDDAATTSIFEEGNLDQAFISSFSAAFGNILPTLRIY